MKKQIAEPAPPLGRLLESYREEMIENLRRLVRIPSVSDQEAPGAPFGPENRKALDFVLELGKKKGFDTVNYDNYAAELSSGEGTESVGVVTHLDVVPGGTGWSRDPFGGETEDGIIYGRGTTDDKGPLIAAFYACLAIRESGLPVTKKIRHIIGTNEETGDFPCIRHYLEKTDPPACGIVPDSWFPAAFAEKGFFDFCFSKKLPDPEHGEKGRQENGGTGGGGEERPRLISLKGGTAVNVVAPEAEAVFEGTEEAMRALGAALIRLPGEGSLHCCPDGSRLTLRAAGKAAHASVPETGVNAVGILLRALRTVSFEPRALRETLACLEEMIGRDWNGKGLGIAFEDHTGFLTNNPGILSFDGQELKVKMNARLPVTLDPERLEDALKKAAEKAGTAYSRLCYNPHFYMEKDHPVMKTLLSVYREMTGDRVSEPVAHGGGSYARILKNFVPFGPAMQGEELLFHKPDEFISCERLLMLGKIYAEALYRLAR